MAHFQTGVTEEQIAEYKEAFALFDNKNNNTIAIKDLATVLRSLGQNPSETEVAEMLQLADPDGAGVVDFDTFLSLIQTKVKEQDNEGEIRESFRVFDKEGNGKISSSELRHIMTTLGDKLTEDEVDEMLNEAEADPSGMINYEAFARILTSKY